MVNVNLLKAKLKERSLNVESLVPVIGCEAVSTVYRKLDENGRTLTVKEAQLIGNFLKLTAEEMNSIFFAPYVA